MGMGRRLFLIKIYSVVQWSGGGSSRGQAKLFGFFRPSRLLRNSRLLITGFPELRRPRPRGAAIQPGCAPGDRMGTLSSAWAGSQESCRLVWVFQSLAVLAGRSLAPGASPQELAQFLFLVGRGEL